MCSAGVGNCRNERIANHRLAATQKTQNLRVDLQRAVERLTDAGLEVMAGFIRGFRALHFMGPCVTVFGSARFTEEHRYYRLAREVGGELAKKGFTIHAETYFARPR